jgi:hypothetical protein
MNVETRNLQPATCNIQSHPPLPLPGENRPVRAPGLQGLMRATEIGTLAS